MVEVVTDGGESLLLAEQHHRVQNILQLVQTVLSRARRSASPSTTSILREVEAQINGFAVLNDLLQTPQGLYEEATCCTRFLSRLSDELDASCLRPIGITLITLFPGELRVEARTCRHLGLLLTELVFNAVKHAFPSRRGTIGVTLASDDAGVRMIVVDDGVGLSFAPPNGRISSGRGRRFMEMLAGAVGGSIVTQSSSSGTQVEVVVPAAARDHSCPRRGTGDLLERAPDGATHGAPAHP